MRAIHKPTGIVVRATKERSLGQNKKMALYLLNERINALQNAEQARARKERRDSQPDAAFGGAHVRTYRMVDDREVTDHRTGVKIPLSRALDGDLDPLILPLLRATAP